MTKKHLNWNFLLLLLIFSFSNQLALAGAYDPSASVYRFQKKMAKRGNAESQFKLGLMFETGSGVEQGLVNAILWYKRAADQNFKPAINRLTYIDIKKSGFTRSHNRWVKQLQKDAQFNEGEALFLLGQMYSEGTGIKKDLEQALILLRKAARSDIPGSETEINRVEDELAILKEKAAKEKQKRIIALNLKHAKPDLTKPLSLIPALAPLNHNPLKTSPPRRPFITVEELRKQQARARELRNKKQQPKKLKTNQIALNKPPLNKVNKPVIKPPLRQTKPLEKIEEHPMDIICGGINMLQNGCR